MKFVPNAVSVKIARAALVNKKYSPQTLFFAGLVGMGATVVLSCRATLQVEAVLDETEKQIANRPASETNRIKLETGLALCKLYAPALIVGVASVSALAGSHNILSKRNAALTAAYGTVSKALDEYRERVRSALGEDREKELYYDVQACEIDDPDKPGKKKTVKRANSYGIYARLFDSNNRNFEPTPEYNWHFLKLQQSYWNDRLLARGHVFLNEVYDSIGFERSKEGAVVGWLKNGSGDGFIDFGIFENAEERVVEFMSGQEKAIWLDFNVDGTIYDKI